jgi:protoheme IX farnesyltransferase
MSRIRMILELGKHRIALLVALSTLTGYVLAGGKISIQTVIPVAGIYLLALGSGALNQYQERRKDALMPRTSGRPIPAGLLSPFSAVLIAFLLMLLGTTILLVGTNITAVWLGLLTVLWYNGIYTYLKKITPLAVIPGSVIGALPPLVGWAAVNENIFQIQPLILAIFFFIWQIPHFWLLLLNFGKDYEKAGYPALTALLDQLQLGRLTFIWIVATAVSIILMPLFGLGSSNVIYFLLFTASIILIWSSVDLLKISKMQTAHKVAFRGINIFILVVMFLLSVEKLFNFR